MAALAQQLPETSTDTVFEGFHDRSGGLVLFFDWERVAVEIKPDPSWGFSIFFPAWCLADVDERKITTVDFFTRDTPETLAPDAMEKVLDEKAREMISSGQGTRF